VQVLNTTAREEKSPTATRLRFQRWAVSLSVFLAISSSPHDTPPFWRANDFDEYARVRTTLLDPWLDGEEVELVCLDTRALSDELWMREHGTGYRSI
jgi:hypothetical protein